MKLRTATLASFAVFLVMAITVLSRPLRLPAAPAETGRWAVGTPIVTYWAGPPMSDAVARQMKEGSFNVVWCGEKDLDLLQKHGLRGMVQDALLAPATIDSPEQRLKLDALIERVRTHPAFYSY